MRTIVVTILLCCIAAPAAAGAYGKISGGGLVLTPPADCSTLTHITEDFPDWSRLQWSVKTGGAWSFDIAESGATSALAVVPQLSWQFWGREGQCSGGGGFLGGRSWRRLSLAYSFDAAWRIAAGDTPSPDKHSVDVRPGLRLARATYDTGFMTVGSPWVPSFELAVTAGPTFDPGLTGAAISVSATAAILSLELRVAARTEGRGQEVMLLVGLADVHGLWKLGPKREYQYE